MEKYVKSYSEFINEEYKETAEDMEIIRKATNSHYREVQKEKYKDFNIISFCVFSKKTLDQKIADKKYVAIDDSGEPYTSKDLIPRFDTRKEAIEYAKKQIDLNESLDEGLWSWIKSKFKKSKQAKKIIEEESNSSKKQFNKFLRDLRTKYTLDKNNSSYKINTKEKPIDIVKYINYEGYSIVNLINKSTIKFDKESTIDYGKYGIKTGSGGVFKYYAVLNIISDDDVSISYYNYAKDKKIMEPILKSKLEDVEPPKDKKEEIL